MKSKYLKNYKNVDYTDENGKVKTRVEYIGKIFDFENGTKPRLNAVAFPVLTFSAAVFFIVALAVDSAPLRTLYFTIPFIAQIFTLFSLVLTAVKYLTVKSPLEEKDKERLTDKTKTTCLAGIVLTAVCLVCYVIKLCLKGFDILDLIPVLCDGFCLTTYAVLFVLTNNTVIVLKENENAKTPEIKEEKTQIED